MTKPKLNGEPLNILLIEDNMVHAELIKLNLKEHRVANKIYHVTDEEMALDFLFKRGNFAGKDNLFRPHLILLDLRLPKIDGLEVLQEIKFSDELKQIPVIVLTTSEAENDVIKAYSNYVNSYIIKPLDFEKFSQLMETLGFYWMGWNYYPWNDEK